MNRYLKTSFFLFLCYCTNISFSQNHNNDLGSNNTLSPKFVLGSGFYSLAKDNSGLLQGNVGVFSGVQFDIVNDIDLSFLFLKTDLSSNQFNSQVNGIGLYGGYTIKKYFKNKRIKPNVSFGIESLSFKTNENERENSFALPFGIGINMLVSEKIELDIAYNIGISMADFDKIDNNSDNYKSLTFALSYSLFKSKNDKKDNETNDTYYADIDFESLDLEDEDNDLVPDIQDQCHKTPKGVEVDKNGCPLDSDNDGIPNYLDKQQNTLEGVIVDENGVELSVEKYKSMYLEFDVASREYAEFYNDHEIKRENYLNVDEYLIAKANAFNKAFYESRENNKTVQPIIYKVKLGEYKKDMPISVQRSFLSIDNLESYSEEDGTILYLSGSFNSLVEAREYEKKLNKSGYNGTSIVVDNNGNIDSYKPPVLKLSKDSIKSKNTIDSNYVAQQLLDSNNQVLQNQNTLIYRIQIGAFPNVLSEEIFIGVDNVIYLQDKDGLYKYMTGSFKQIENAIDYMFQMRARGFEDAFVVGNKNGEINIEYFAPVKKRNISPILPSNDEVINDQVSNEDLEYIVQILVSKESLDSTNIQKINILGVELDRTAKGKDMFEYYAGKYKERADAELQLEKAINAGFSNAFIQVKKNGKRIPLMEKQK